VFHTSKPVLNSVPKATVASVGRTPVTALLSFATFSDPDGNTWLFQEITARLPGRGLSNLDVSTLTELLRETEQHHGEYEPTAPKAPLVGVVRRLHCRATERENARRAAKLGKLHIEGAQ